MKLKCKVVDVLTSIPEALLDPDDCAIIGVRENDRVRIGDPRERYPCSWSPPTSSAKATW